MKKLLDILKIPLLDQCFQLQIDFKAQRNNLKRYLKSLKELKTRSKTSHQLFTNFASAFSSIVNEHEILKKKNSELDYYLINGIKSFKAFNIGNKKLALFYEKIHTQSKDMAERMIKYLDQSKQNFNRISCQHQKCVKQFAEKCFPETTTILYILGFINVQKIRKIEDLMKQQSIIKQASMYVTILNTYLDQMQNLKVQIGNIFKQYYMGSIELWMNSNQDFQNQLKSYEIKQEEIETYFKETGGVITDRSDRSNRENNDVENDF